MSHVEGIDRDQITLFPEALDDYVSEENPVRFIDAFVESLNLEGLGFTHAVPNDLGRQDFHAEKPNQKWVADITYIETRERWLYLAALVDLCSRSVVGWSMAEQMDTSLVEKALDMALGRRNLMDCLLHLC